MAHTNGSHSELRGLLLGFGSPLESDAEDQPQVVRIACQIPLPSQPFHHLSFVCFFVNCNVIAVTLKTKQGICLLASATYLPILETLFI